MTPSPTPTAVATAAPATSPSTSLCLCIGPASPDRRPAEPEQPPAGRRWGTCCELPVGIACLLLLDGRQLPSSSSSGCLILGSMKETRRMVFHGGRWCDLHASAAMAWEPEYLRTCINENPGCLFITTNCDPTRHMTSAQEWSGARNMVAAVSCSLQSKVLNSKMKGQWMHSLLIFNAMIS